MPLCLTGFGINLLLGPSPRMQGFIVTDWGNEFPEAIAQLGQWLNEGKIKRKETLVTGGLAAAEEALNYLFNGKSFGK